MKGTPLDLDFNLNTMSLTDGRFGNGIQRNITKQEFADWVVECLPDMDIKDRHTQHWLRDDGRVLSIFCIVFPAASNYPERIEYNASCYTLQQRTPRCLRRWKHREGFFYKHKPNKTYYKQKNGYWYYIYI